MASDYNQLIGFQKGLAPAGGASPQNPFYNIPFLGMFMGPMFEQLGRQNAGWTGAAPAPQFQNLGPVPLPRVSAYGAGAEPMRLPSFGRPGFGDAIATAFARNGRALPPGLLGGPSGAPAAPASMPPSGGQ